MSSLIPTTSAMVPAPSMLPTSLTLGQVVYHVNNYVSGSPAKEAFRKYKAESYLTLLRADDDDSRVLRPVKCAGWELSSIPGEFITSSWGESRRKQEQQETREIYFPALDAGFRTFTTQLKSLPSAGRARRALLDERMRVNEFPLYVANGLVSADTMADLVATLIEKNAEAGFWSSADLMVRPENEKQMFFDSFNTVDGMAIIGALWGYVPLVPVICLITANIFILLVRGRPIRAVKMTAFGAALVGASWLVHHLYNNIAYTVLAPLIIGGLLAAKGIVKKSGIRTKNDLELRKIQEQISGQKPKALLSGARGELVGKSLQGSRRELLQKALQEIREKDTSITDEEIGRIVRYLLNECRDEEAKELLIGAPNAQATYRTNGDRKVLPLLKKP